MGFFYNFVVLFICVLSWISFPLNTSIPIMEFGIKTGGDWSNSEGITVITLWFNYTIYQFSAQPNALNTWYLAYRDETPTFNVIGRECPKTSNDSFKIMIDHNHEDALGVDAAKFVFDMKTQTDIFWGIDMVYINNQLVDIVCISNKSVNCVGKSDTNGIYKQIMHFNLVTPNVFIADAIWENASNIIPNPKLCPDLSISPTYFPSFNPTNGPIHNPTNTRTNDPTNNPTHNPSDGPTNNPTYNPTNNPTNGPSLISSTEAPSVHPSATPSAHETQATFQPISSTNAPTETVSKHPLSLPISTTSQTSTVVPSNIPSKQSISYPGTTQPETTVNNIQITRKLTALQYTQAKPTDNENSSEQNNGNPSNNKEVDWRLYIRIFVIVSLLAMFCFVYLVKRKMNTHKNKEIEDNAALEMDGKQNIVLVDEDDVGVAQVPVKAEEGAKYAARATSEPTTNIINTQVVKVHDMKLDDDQQEGYDKNYVNDEQQLTIEGYDDEQQAVVDTNETTKGVMVDEQDVYTRGALDI